MGSDRDKIRKRRPIVPASANPNNNNHWLKLGVIQTKGTMNVIKTAPDKPVNIKVNKGLSKLESFLVDIIYKAYEKPAPIAAKLAGLNSLNPGLITIKAPIKPNITAIHLLNPTFSFKIIEANKVTSIGETNIKVKESAKGKIDIA